MCVGTALLDICQNGTKETGGMTSHLLCNYGIAGRNFIRQLWHARWHSSNYRACEGKLYLQANLAVPLAKSSCHPWRSWMIWIWIRSLSRAVSWLPQKCKGHRWGRTGYVIQRHAWKKPDRPSCSQSGQCQYQLNMCAITLRKYRTRCSKIASSSAIRERKECCQWEWWSLMITHQDRFLANFYGIFKSTFK